MFFKLLRHLKIGGLNNTFVRICPESKTSTLGDFLQVGESQHQFVARLYEKRYPHERSGYFRNYSLHVCVYVYI